MQSRTLGSAAALLLVVLCCAVAPSAAQVRRTPIARPQPLPQFQIWDCYNDTGRLSSVLQYEDIATSFMMQRNRTARQAEPCVRACLSKGFDYAGVRNHTQCWCGLNVTARPEMAAKCQYCEGNHKFRCGGLNQIAVYYSPKEPIPRFAYQSCLKYETKAERSMMQGIMKEYSYISYRHTPYRQMTSCVRACAARGYVYAGITYSFWCHCGNRLLRNAPSTCPLCQANSRQHCGTQKSISIYKIDIQRSLPRARICGLPNRTVLANHTIALQCESPGVGNQFLWTRSDRYGRTVPFDRFRTSISPSGDSLLVRYVRATDAGRYVCTVVNNNVADVRMRSSRAYANIGVEQPIVLRIRQTKPAIDNRETTLRCEVRGAGQNHLSVMWFHNGMPLGPFSSQALPTGSMINYNPQPNRPNSQFVNPARPGVVQPIGKNLNQRNQYAHVNGLPRTNVNQRNQYARVNGLPRTNVNQRNQYARVNGLPRTNVNQRTQYVNGLPRTNVNQRTQYVNGLPRTNVNQRTQYVNGLPRTNVNQRNQYANGLPRTNVNQRNQYANGLPRTNVNQRNQFVPNTNVMGVNRPYTPYQRQVSGTILSTPFLRFGIEGTTHVLTLRRVSRQFHGNYTCRVFNPLAGAQRSRVVETSFKLRKKGERLYEKFPTPAPLFQGASYDALKCRSKTELGSDGVIVVAVIMAVVNAVLVALVLYMGLRTLKGGSGGGEGKTMSNPTTQ